MQSERHSGPRYPLLFIVGMTVSIFGTPIFDLYFNQSDVFGFSWQPAFVIYLVSVFLGLVIWLGFRGYGKVIGKNFDFTLVFLWLIFIFLWLQVSALCKESVSGESLAWHYAFVAVVASLAFGRSESFRKAVSKITPSLAGIIIFSSVGLDVINVSRYFYTQRSRKHFLTERKEKPVSHSQLPNSSVKHIFHLVFDGLPAVDLLRSVNKNRLFFNRASSGIYYPNAYTNGDNTNESVGRFMSGAFHFMRLDSIFDRLAAIGYRINVYGVWGENCNPTIATCYSFDWALKNLLGWSSVGLSVTSLLHAYLERVNLPVLDRELSLAVQAARAKNIRPLEFKHVWLELFERYLGDLDSVSDPSYEYIHVLIPHPPNALDQNCRVVGDSSRLVERLGSYDEPAFDDQVRCANKLILKFLSKIEKKEFYRNSLIIIQGDHGAGPTYGSLIADATLARKKNFSKDFQLLMERRAKPVLWLKPPFFGSSEVRDHLTILMDVPATIEAAVGLDVSSNDGMNLLGNAYPSDAFSRRDVVLSGNYLLSGETTRREYFLKRDRVKGWSVIDSKELELEVKRKFRLQ